MALTDKLKSMCKKIENFVNDRSRIMSVWGNEEGGVSKIVIKTEDHFAYGRTGTCGTAIRVMDKAVIDLMLSRRNKWKRRLSEFLGVLGRAIIVGFTATSALLIHQYTTSPEAFAVNTENLVIGSCIFILLAHLVIRSINRKTGELESAVNLLANRIFLERYEYGSKRNSITYLQLLPAESVFDYTLVNDRMTNYIFLYYTMLIFNPGESFWPLILTLLVGYYIFPTIFKVIYFLANPKKKHWLKMILFPRLIFTDLISREETVKFVCSVYNALRQRQIDEGTDMAKTKTSVEFDFGEEAETKEMSDEE